MSVFRAFLGFRVFLALVVGIFVLLPAPHVRADPCGDVDVDGDVDAIDVSTFRTALADPTGSPLSAPGVGNCTVYGSPRPCDLLDVVVLRRELNAPTLAPGVSPLCASSLAGCDVLNAAECMLPYPSTHYLETAATPTGFRLALTQATMPEVFGDPIDPAAFNEVDGFSPTVQMLMHFPQGVDLVASNASRLLPAAAPGPPWIDTRTYTGRSLDPNSPSVLIDADTGERILHFLEADVRAAGNAPRQALILRPGLSLVPGHRYIVAMRDLTAPGGAAVVAEAAFAALRDGVITSDPAIEGRRTYFDTSIFGVLTANGIPKAPLVLAFDFVVQSEHQLTHQMLAIRDQAFAYTAAVEANPFSSPFFESSRVQNDCNVPGETVWREVSGTFLTPLFLTAAPTSSNTPQHSVDPNDVPVQNTALAARIDVSIPCTVLDPNGPTLRPLLLGHGLFGSGESMMGIPPEAAPVTPWNYISGATDWRGLHNQSLAWVGTQIIGVGTSKINEFRAFPDRLRQGMSDTLVLSRFMQLGILNRDPAFQLPGGAGVFPGPTEEMYYYGISLGGVMGTWLAALSPDIERYGLDVPSMNFSCLLQRSTQFDSFETLLEGIGLTDPMDTLLGYGLLHELWASAEPAGYARHVTTDPFVGSGGPSKILMTPAWLDKQVSNTCTEATARTLGLVSHEGSIQQGLQGIPDSTGPQDSALVMYDTGAFDLFNPLHAPFIPPLANQIPSPKCDPHNDRPMIEAGVDQLTAFLAPAGQIHNFCSGTCDAGNAYEQPPTLCDPLVP